MGADAPRPGGPVPLPAGVNRPASSATWKSVVCPSHPVNLPGYPTSPMAQELLAARSHAPKKIRGAYHWPPIPFHAHAHIAETMANSIGSPRCAPPHSSPAATEHPRQLSVPPAVPCAIFLLRPWAGARGSAWLSLGDLTASSPATNAPSARVDFASRLALGRPASKTSTPFVSLSPRETALAASNASACPGGVRNFTAPRPPSSPALAHMDGNGPILIAHPFLLIAIALVACWLPATPRGPAGSCVSVLRAE